MILEEKKRVMVYPKAVPDPEVPEKTVRRKFTATYKLRILKEADNCTELGQLGALLPFGRAPCSHRFVIGLARIRAP